MNLLSIKVSTIYEVEHVLEWQLLKGFIDNMQNSVIQHTYDHPDLN